MDTLVLSQSDVRSLLSMENCIEWVAQALRDLSSGQATNPLRSSMAVGRGQAWLGLMPGKLEDPDALGLKVLSVFPKNHKTPYDSHQGLILLFDSTCGLPRAVIDASAVTAVRTASASAVATRVLARSDAADLAILGAGTQARSHLEAMSLVRPIERVRIFSPTPAHREVFAQEADSHYAFLVEAVDTAAQAVIGADLLCTTTSSATPVVHAEWLVPGAHINAVGACTPRTRELDVDVMRRAALFCDSRESLFHEAGDFLAAQQAGAIGQDSLRGEIGEVLLGRASGRRDANEITVFESLGVAVEDLATAHYLAGAARATGTGTWVELGGRRET